MSIRDLRRVVPSGLSESASRALRRWVPSPIRDHVARSRHPAPPAFRGRSWVCAPPDFVGIGVQRAGTTWWFNLLLSHPQIERPPDLPKELHYFDRMSSGDHTGVLARYGDFFPRRPGRLSGEWTPGYIAQFWTPPLLRAAAPDAKLLVLVRDPIERYRSGIVHNRVEGHVWGPFSAEVAYARGLYRRQLRHVLRSFPGAQVLVLQYESCLRDADGELRRTFAFLGVEPFHEVPEGRRQRQMNFNPPKAELGPDTHRWLYEAYEEDVSALAREFPGIDLALWPNFAHLA